MNKQQFFLMCLIEELTEAAKEFTKCVKFTPDHRYHGYEKNNIERAQFEVADIYAVADILHEMGIETGFKVPLTMCPDMAFKFKEKRVRTLESWDIAEELAARETLRRLETKREAEAINALDH